MSAYVLNKAANIQPNAATHFPKVRLLRVDGTD
jgi:hypothetical protein